MKISENFNYNIAKLRGELLISIQGDLDMYTTSILQETVGEYLVPEIVKVTIDCDAVQYVDSSFLQFLTSISGYVEKVRITNASRTIRRIFEIAGLDKVFIDEDRLS